MIETKDLQQFVGLKKEALQKSFDQAKATSDQAWARVEGIWRMNKEVPAKIAELKERWTRIHRIHDKESQKLAALVGSNFAPAEEIEDCSVQESAVQPEADTQGSPSLQKEWKQVLQGQTVQKIEKSGRNQFEVHTVDPEQLSARRRPPPDRPPDKPPPCKGASGGSLHERAGSRHLGQLASSSCGSHSLSGIAAHLESIQINVQSPSNYSETWVVIFSSAEEKITAQVSEG
jgi:hypothetical protein